jgi:hypothetical protein
MQLKITKKEHSFINTWKITQAYSYRLKENIFDLFNNNSQI